MNHPLDRLVLRDMDDRDLPIFFQHQSDPAANFMAAFTSKNPAGRRFANARGEEIEEVIYKLETAS